MDLHLMAKPTGAICNLDCTYCFFLEKEDRYLGSSFRMPEDVHEEYVRQVLEAGADQREVVLALQGGEPTLMGIDYVRRTAELGRRFARPGQRVQLTMQTNATLIDDEWAACLAELDVLVGVSIDGPQDLHDRYRVDKGGKPTFDRVIAGLDALNRHGVAWNAMTTVHAANGDHGRAVYRFLRDELGATFIQLIPVVEHAGGGIATEWSVTAEQWGRFLVEVFDEWHRDDVGDVFVNMFDTALGHWMGMDQWGMCVHAVTCGTALALEHNGDVYSCDHYVDDDDLLGNITGGRSLLELASSPEQLAFGSAKRDTLPDMCLACDVRFACNGGCPKDRFATTPDGEAGLHYLCAGYQRFFRHIDAPMTAMAAALRAGLDARSAQPS